jgi:hypothetical protein
MEAAAQQIEIHAVHRPAVTDLELADGRFGQHFVDGFLQDFLPILFFQRGPQSGIGPCRPRRVKAADTVYLPAELGERMSSPADVGLTGVWDGLFSYPRNLPAVPFTAVILEIGSAISGSIHEQPTHGRSAGQTLTAAIEGEHIGSMVRFLKTYDPAHKTHGLPIRYEGVLTPDGDEIEGRWTIPGNWSGKFLMMRSGRRQAVARTRRRRIVPVG